ncbi:hypothetical protein C8R48DRAFT_677239 [Suillus tomentosus]|nr:hypothetical protein C8R48DRAFT_677239 [Suillus tomentosus]
MTKSASVEQSAPNKPPKLLPGELTPEVARDWDNACTTYFMHKEVNAPDQVKMIAFGMLDPRLHMWYLAQRAILDAGTFADYMTALKNGWLDTHWDTRLRKKVLGSRQGTRPFYEWALELQNQNTLLYGNAAHLSDIQLRNQLEANVCNELTTAVLRARLADNLTLREWIEEVKHLDDKRLEDVASHKKIAKELYKSSKRTTSSYQNKAPSSSKTFNSSSRLGPLTETERNLLVEHKGCFKCRKFYVSHCSKECTDGAPEASTYKALTEADANAAKPKTTRARTVAADSKYDLLAAPKRPTMFRSPLPSLCEVKKLRKNVVKELRKVLKDRGSELEEHTTSQGTNIASVLRKRIETLAFIETNKEHLERLDREMRRKYEDRYRTSHTPEGSK